MHDVNIDRRLKIDYENENQDFFNPLTKIYKVNCHLQKRVALQGYFNKNSKFNCKV